MRKLGTILIREIFVMIRIIWLLPPFKKATLVLGPAENNIHLVIVGDAINKFTEMLAKSFIYNETVRLKFYLITYRFGNHLFT